MGLVLIASLWLSGCDSFDGRTYACYRILELRGKWYVK